MAFPSNANFHSPQTNRHEKRANIRTAKSAAMTQINQLIASGGVPATHPVLPKTSYCINTLYRIETMAKAIAQTRKMVDSTKEQLEQRLQTLHRGKNEAKKYQTLRMKVNLLQDQLKRETKELIDLRQKRKKPATVINNCNDKLNNSNNDHQDHDAIIYQEFNRSNAHEVEDGDEKEYDDDGKEKDENDTKGLWPDLNVDRCEQMAHYFERMKRQSQHFKDQQQKSSQKRIELNRLQDLIYLRRKQLCCELLCLFPISGQPPNKQSIVNVPFPPPDKLLNCNDHQVEAAVGFVCQMLIVLSKLIDVPLHFDLLFHGSQNWIVDKTQAELESFPLFHRNGKRDRNRFNYALFLLNRNIAQLCQHFQLPVADLQLTLSNLHALFRDRLIYKKEDLTKINSVLNSTKSTNRPETPLVTANPDQHPNEEDNHEETDCENQKDENSN